MQNTFFQGMDGMGWDGWWNPTKWKCWERNIEPINFPKQINNFTHIHITLEKMKKFFFVLFIFVIYFLPNLEIGKRGSAAKWRRKKKKKEKGISKTAKTKNHSNWLSHRWFQGDYNQGGRAIITRPTTTITITTITVLSQPV